ncbi:ABC transporter permease [Thioflexithrix psekupsensis]|nr:ABC transporter permease [Thioflexithrix psekupsensis]
MSNKMSLLFRYVELILYKTYADLRAESARTYLGFLWWIFEPMMFMGIFYIVFGLMLGHKTDNYVPFLLVGLTVWQWFKSCLSHGANTIGGALYITRQVYLPKIIFPIILILTDTTKFIFIFSLLLVFLWINGFPPTVHYLAIPILFMVQILFIAGFTFLLAAIVPFIPDLRFVVENILTAVFFGSGVFMSADIVPEAYRFYYYLNPMVNIIESYRNVLMYHTWPNWTSLLIVLIFSLIMIVISTWLVRKFEYIYPKVTS